MLDPSSLLLVAEGAPPTRNFLMEMLPFLLMMGVVWLLVLRPMGKQEKDRKKRVEALKKGDEVVLGGGILGRITNLDDAQIAVVEIAERVRIRVLRKDLVDAAPGKVDTKSEPKSDAKKDAAAAKADA